MGIKVRHNGQWVEMGFAGAPGGEPVGTIIAWGGSGANIPSNFRLCNGQALSRTTYSELFSKLGTIHGSGDGSTTFNIPDLRNKFIVGAKNSTGDTTYPGLSPGATGGSAYATLPSHSHGSGTLVTANHRHNFPGDDHLAFANGVAGWNTNTNGTFSMDADSSSSGNGKMWYTTYSGSLSVSGNTSTEGASTLNANLPPYYALCYIIKIETSSATGSGVADGDYGDITVSNSGTVWNIDQDTIGPTELISTGVSAGSYTNANISVDVDGRITSASSGSTPVTTFLGLSDTPSTYVPSAGKVLVVNSTQNGVEFVDKSTITSGLFQDKISEGDSKAEIIDTATESKFTVEIDATEIFEIATGGLKIHREDSSLEGGSISFNRAADDALAFEIDVYGSSNTNSNRFRIVDQSIPGGVERFAIGPNGEIGLGYVSATSANYGTAGQVLTSGGPGAGVTWADASGGVGSSDPVGTIVAWAGSVASIPSEYQLCDGGAAATSELQAITGTNVPDLRERFIVGAGGDNPTVAGSTGYGVSATGGANTVTLTLNQIPAHNHFDSTTSGGGGPSQWGIDVDGNGSALRVDANDGPPWNNTKGNLSRGGGQAHENRPPYYALCYIIKHTAISGSGSGGSAAGDKISEGDTEAEVVDTGFDGHFKVTTEGTERLRVTSNGSVGIGTTNPEGSQNSNPLFATKLDVFKSFVGGGDGSFVGRFYGLDTNVQETSVRFITKGTGGTAADLYNASDAYLMHGISNGDTKFVFGANGNVGIGTTNPNVAVDSTNTAKLAVGIVTCHELYVNGTQITGSGSGGGEPVGTIVAWSGTVSNIPTGYQLCDGTAADTPELAAITGTNVPDLRERFIIGAGGDNSTVAGSTGYAVNATGGANTVALTLNQIPAHTHQYNRANSRNVSDGGVVGAEVQNNNFQTTGPAGGDTNGNTVAHENLPPYYALCYIIKHTATSGSGSGGSGFVLEAAKTATGSSVEFTNIPTDAYEITLMFNGVSLDGSGSILVELGTSSSYITQGYTATSQTEDGSNEVDVTNAFTIYSASNYLHHGKFDINKFSDTSYTFEGQSRTLTNGGVQAYGSLNGISGTITKLKIRPANTGSGVQFDSGSFSLSYKTASTGSSSGAGDKISEGDSKAEIIDTATESKFTVEIDAAEKFSVDIGGSKIHRQDNSNEGGSIVFNRAADDVAAFELDVHGSSSSDSGVFRIIDATGGGERFLIGPAGQIGLSGANYGSSGQVLTSNGSGSAPTWQSASGGSGGTVSSGTFTATAGSPSTLESYTYDSAELVFEYTVFVKNGSNYQTQKLLVMRDGTTVDSSQYAVMYNSNLLVQLDATISGGNLNLRATPETGVNGSTTYRIKREVV